MTVHIDDKCKFNIAVKIDNKGKTLCKIKSINYDCIFGDSIITNKNSREKELKNTPIEVTDGTRILLYNKQTKRLEGECILWRNNPARCLSQVIQTSVGKKRYIVTNNQTDLLIQQTVTGLLGSINNNTYKANKIVISLDPILSKEFQNEIQNYLNTTIKNKYKGNAEYDMSVTIMDIATGQILASPYWSTRLDNEPVKLRMLHKNTSLVRRYIGSTFKPLMSLAAVLEYPDLLELDTRKVNLYHRNGNDMSFLGYKVQKGWGLKTWTGCNMTQFLAKSDDVFPVVLATVCFNDKPLNGRFEYNRKGWFKVENNYLKFQKDEDKTSLDRNLNFIQKLSYLYHLDYDENDSKSDFWRAIKKHMINPLKPFELESLTPHPVSLNLDLFLKGEEITSGLVPWVLGQGNNEWNCIKLAEAWSRMLTLKDIKSSFIQLEDEDKPVSLNFRNETYKIWKDYLKKLRMAAYENNCTYHKMTTAVTSLNKNLALFAKTGTPDEYTRREELLIDAGNRWFDCGLFVFSLVENKHFARYLGNDNPKGKSPRGITCVVRITKTTAQRTNAINSSDAYYFFTENDNIRLKKLYELTKNYIQ